MSLEAYPKLEILLFEAKTAKVAGCLVKAS
jgi:hypothetical protein